MPGLSGVLAGEVTIAKGIRPHADVPEMLVMPASTAVQNPARLLQDGALAKLLQDLRQKCDAVIVDLPPVLAVADASATSACMDGVVVVSRFGSTSRFTLARAVEQLRQVKSPLLGAAINRVSIARASGRYSGYYGYYYDDRGY